MVLNQTIGITGSSGLLGKHVVNFFLNKEFNIIATNESNPKIIKKIFLREKN